MTTLKAALVGAGMMGRNHARVLSSLEGVDLVAVIDENGDQHGSRGPATLFRSLNDLPVGLADFAVVATPTSTHQLAVEKSFDMGMHVLVEKPLADTVEAAVRIATKMQETGLVGAVGHIERFNPAIQELKQRLSAGEIGDVYQIATRRQGSFPHRIGDVGVVKDLATHDIELVSWISDSSYEFVFAQASHKSGRTHEDMISVTGRLRNGAIVSHLVNWLSPMKERIVVVTGDKGTFIADTLTGDLTLHENGVFAVEWESFASFRGVTEGNMTRFAFPKKEPLIAELEGFRDYLIDGTGQIVSLEEGIQVLKVAEAILDSQETNSVAFLNKP